MPNADALPENRRCALVTGASRGIGRSIAMALAGAGCSVAVSGRTEQELFNTVAMIQARGGVAQALVADLADPAACRALPGHAAHALGGAVDVLVHNAGMPSSAKVLDASLDDWNVLIQVNATAAFLLAQGVIPGMVRQRWGRIVTIGSVYSRVGVTYGSAYVASKHALLGLTRVLSLELIRHGITANTVIPGWTDTEMVAQQASTVARSRGTTTDAAVTDFLRGQPLGRLITPDEVAGLVGYLCSDLGDAITGQALHVDGGMYQS